jgi:CheY-like chemotaxis protein
MTLAALPSKLVAMTAPAWHHPERLREVRVLVVEDDQDTREIVAEFLALSGAVVFQAPTGVEGFDAFERERPDVVVSDLWMPGGDGYEMIRRIRALPPDRGGLTPAIAISAAEAVRPALTAGFHAFAAKPFDIEMLVGIIADFASPDDQVQPE